MKSLKRTRSARPNFYLSYNSETSRQILEGLNNLFMDESQLQQIASQLRKPQGDNGVKTGELMNRGNSQMNRDTLAVLAATANDNILEIGMGNGFFVKEILAKGPGINYTGCDFSETMTDEAKKINADWVNKGRAKFIHTNADSLPFENNLFNKIFTINTVYFWGDEAKILGEIKRVLHPAGNLILSLRPKYQMINYPFTKYGFKLFSEESMTDLLIKNGFTIVQTIVNHEPDFELNGEVIKLENLIVVAAIV